MTATLISRKDAEFKIAPLTAAPCNVEVMEERAFVGKNKNPASEHKCLSLGSISLKLALQAGDENADAERQRALRGGEGTFEWSLPSAFRHEKSTQRPSWRP